MVQNFRYFVNSVDTTNEFLYPLNSKNSRIGFSGQNIFMRGLSNNRAIFFADNTKYTGNI